MIEIVRYIIVIVVISFFFLLSFFPDKLNRIIEKMEVLINRNIMLFEVSAKIFSAFFVYHIVILCPIVLLLGLPDVWLLVLIVVAYPFYLLINKCVDFIAFRSNAKYSNVISGIGITIYAIYEILNITDIDYWSGCEVYEWSFIFIFVSVIGAYCMIRYMIKQYNINRLVHKLCVSFVVILMSIIIMFCNRENNNESCVYNLYKKTSKRYHNNEKCNGLKRCSSGIKYISLEEAERMGRTPCGFAIN